MPCGSVFACRTRYKYRQQKKLHFYSSRICLLYYIRLFEYIFFGALRCTVKLIPLLVGLIVFELQPHEGDNIIFNIAVGFATFENICYLLEHGTGNLFYLLVRGFSTGAMHITCAFIIGYGLRVFRRPGALKASGIFALLCVAITFHAMFNMLMKTDGLIKQFGYAVPIVSCLILFLLKYRFRKITDSK